MTETADLRPVPPTFCYAHGLDHAADYAAGSTLAECSPYTTEYGVAGVNGAWGLHHALAAMHERKDERGRDLSADERTPAEVAALTAALIASAEQYQRSAVRELRAAGSSWEHVGQLLGVSRQAAQQRFGPKARRRTA